MTGRMRTRIAPTPSGYLHIGNAVNFVLTWRLARRHGGKVLLRIDDLDPQMCAPDFVDDIFETLVWLGIDWDEGPRSPSDLADTWSQRHRVPLYHAALDELRRGGHVFGCTCTRKQIAEHAHDGRYPGTCLDAGLDLDATDVAWRFADPSVHELPYPVVRQKSGLPAYQIASIVDDVHFGITHVVRGMDLRPSSGVQRLLASVIAPLRSFAEVTVIHHDLMTGADGTKLSKSQGAWGVREMRHAGQGPEAIHRMAQAMIDRATFDM